MAGDPEKCHGDVKLLVAHRCSFNADWYIITWIYTLSYVYTILYIFLIKQMYTVYLYSIRVYVCTMVYVYLRCLFLVGLVFSLLSGHAGVHAAGWQQQACAWTPWGQYLRWTCKDQNIDFFLIYTRSIYPTYLAKWPNYSDILWSLCPKLIAIMSFPFNYCSREWVPIFEAVPGEVLQSWFEEGAAMRPCCHMPHRNRVLESSAQ